MYDKSTKKWIIKAKEGLQERIDKIARNYEDEKKRNHSSDHKKFRPKEE